MVRHSNTSVAGKTANGSYGGIKLSSDTISVVDCFCYGVSGSILKRPLLTSCLPLSPPREVLPT
jgi:hypothetical protein